ncbi:glycoside hydrolase family 97 catalytic domain-containing protein [Ligaoa zhengdingensis]|uniref:glycoside hydrolase family 97 catalytic domain-containing protein n=1 Tax=Ligaoa zhengdingensis TaxID=2763658 RepID=UPI0031BB633A
MKKGFFRKVICFVLACQLMAGGSLVAFAEGQVFPGPPTLNAETVLNGEEEPELPDKQGGGEETPAPPENSEPDEEANPAEGEKQEEAPLFLSAEGFRSEIDIALGEKTYASSCWSGAGDSLVVDGATGANKHWCPNGGGDQWVAVDFGTLRQFDRVVITFNYASRVQSFQLEKYNWEQEEWESFYESTEALTGGDDVQVTAEVDNLAASKIRLRFGEDTSYPCVSEIEVYNDDPLVDGASIEITTGEGVPPTMPQQINIDQADGGRVLVPIEWEEVDQYQYENPGTYVVSGTYEPENITVTADIEVVEGRGIAESPTPYMGWNHWYADYMDVTQEKVDVQVDKLLELGLDQAGYDIVWIDDGGWGRPGSEYAADTEREYRDESGNIVFNDRFHKDMGQYIQSIHDKGLKFGIYTDTGPWGCGSIFGSGGPNWFENYRKDVALYESWGVDAIKLDHCGGHNGLLNNYQVYAGFYQAMLAEDPDANMLLNVCEWGEEDPASWAYKIAASWRTGGDMVYGNAVSMSRVFDQFDVNISPSANRVGAYNDPDYLIIGDYGLNDDQERTYFTLWAMSAGPLILSGDLTNLTEHNLATITNKDMIAINQDPLVKQPVLIREDVKGLQVYAKELEPTEPGKARYAIMLLNRGNEEAGIGFDWSDVGLAHVTSAHNVWEGKDEVIAGTRYSASVAKEGTVVLIAEGDPVERGNTRRENNYARSGIAQSNSSWSSSNRALVAIDGNTASYWSGRFADADDAYWIQVDLGAEKTFDEINLIQGTYYQRPKASRLEYQDSNGDWITIAEIGAMKDGDNIFSFEPVTARAVRWYVSESTEEKGDGSIREEPPTLCEFQIFDSNNRLNENYENLTDVLVVDNLALAASAAASSYYGAGYDAAKINDGDLGTRWNLAEKGNEEERYVQLDFPSAVRANNIQIHFGEWYQRIVKATVKYDDGTGWKDLAVISDAPQNDELEAESLVTIRHDGFDVVKLKIAFDEIKNYFNGTDPSLYEIEVRNYPVIAIKPVSATTVAGVAPVLPSSVTTVRGDKVEKVAAVVWDTIPAEAYAQAGTFTVEGAVAGTDLKATATVTVTGGSTEVIPITSIRFVKDNETVEVGKSVKLEVIVEPANHTEQVFFETCCPKLAKVDEFGNVTGECPGATATITAKNADGTVFDECTVKVTYSSDTVMLIEQPVQESANGYGQMLFNGKNAGGTSITLWNGEKAIDYGRGIGMHAFASGDAKGPARVVYDISEFSGYNVFRATAGVDYYSDSGAGGTRGTCEFKVLLDGKEAYSSGVLGSVDPAVQIAVLIPEGTRTIALVAADGGDGINCDWADWVDPRLESDPEAPHEFVSFSAKADKGTLHKGETAAITASGIRLDGTPVDGITGYCTYASSDEAVVTVDGAGVITAVGKGSAVITVTAEVDGTVKTAKIAVTVLPDREDCWVVSSPSGNIELLLLQTVDGGLEYMALSDGKLVVEPSPLGLTTSIGEYTDGLIYQNRSDVEIDETYPMISGKKAEYRNHANEATFTFTKEGIEDALKVIARAYDDGVAFRYAIDGDKEFTISSEASGFRVPAASETTMLAYGGLGHCYEDMFANGTIEATAGKTYNMPFLYRTAEGEWALLTEAALSTEYCGSVLKGSDGRLMKVEFAPTQGGNAVVTKAPWVSPWRTAIIGGPKEIVENTMPENLSPSCAIEDTSWIKPATTAWTWYVSPGYGPQSDPELIKQYIDVAAELGWKYFLMDEGWQGKYGTVDDSWHKWVGIPDWLDEVVAYGREKGVGIMAWVHSGDIDTPKEQEFIKELHDHGVVGMKIDFIDSESQTTMKLYDTLYRICAENEMMLDIHGANKPTGEVRTWPNLLTREGIRAQEFNDVRAAIDTMYVFTRTAIGPADYNPCIDLLQGGDVTAGHKVALNILYETGLPCPSDKVETYKRLPVYTLVKNMPARWDDTVFLSGAPGESAALARRNGEDWYVAAICTDAQDAIVPLDFLGDGEYNAYIYMDGSSRWDIDLKIQKVTAADVLTVPMSQNGGCTIKIVKDDLVLPEALSLSEDRINLVNGASTQLEAVFTPEDAQYLTNVEWSSSNDEVVSVENGVLTAHKLGTAVITAKASIPMEGYEPLTAFCVVDVVRADYILASPWTRQRPESRFRINSEYSVTTYPCNGQIDTDGNAAKNFLSFQPEDEDFTLVVKCDFAPESSYQTAGITVHASDNKYVGILRRFHSNFGGNIFEAIKVDGDYNEPHISDPNPNQPVFLRMEKVGDAFKSYYSTDSEHWILVGENTLSLSEGERWTVAVSAFAGTLAPDSDIPATFANFTYNGVAMPFARKDDATAQVIGVIPSENCKVELGTSAEELILPQVVGVTLDNGEVTDLAVKWSPDGYEPNRDGICILSGELILSDGLLNDAGLKVSVRVIVGDPKPAEKAMLEALIEAIDGKYDEFRYTAESWAPFMQALEAAKRVAADDAALQSEVYAAFNALVLARDRLIYAVDDSLLKLAVELAERALENTGLSETSKKALAEQVEAAKELLGSAQKTQAEVNEMYAAVMKAITQLAKVDKLLLADLAAEGDQLHREKYTTASWNAFTAALMAARQVLEDDAASEAQVQEAHRMLTDAMTALQLLGDKSALQNAMDLAKVLMESGRYDQESLTELAALMDQAQAILDREEATQEEIGAMGEALTRAMAKVRLIQLVKESGQLTASNYTSASWSRMTAARQAALSALSDENAGADALNRQFSLLQKAVDGLRERSASSGGSSHAVSTSGGDYWSVIQEKIASAADGDTIQAKLEDGEMMPAAGIDLLNDRNINLKLEIGGKDYILSGTALKGYDAAAVYYTAQQLIAMAGEKRAPDTEAVSGNPETGGEAALTVAPEMPSNGAVAAESELETVSPADAGQPAAATAAGSLVVGILLIAALGALWVFKRKEK